MMQAGDAGLQDARHLLFMPDLLAYFLTGQRRSEYTVASTSQLLDIHRRQWSRELVERLGLAPDLLQPLVEPATLLAELEPGIGRETGLSGTRLIATATHDTAAAVAAVPARGDDWAYLSSGTWSLLGIETKAPLLSAAAKESNFTNEGGVGGSIRFLKNIMGLWLLQCLKNVCPAWQHLSHADLLQSVPPAGRLRVFVDPDCPAFLNPRDIRAEMDRYCQLTGQGVAGDDEAHAAVILESLALKYRLVLDQIRTVSGRAVNRLHVVGGGARNERLCQFTANVTGLPVYAGPVEASALGNLGAQAVACGEVASWTELRSVIAHSFPVREFVPQERRRWEDAYQRFIEILASYPEEENHDR
jgi:rhamnulokinase